MAGQPKKRAVLEALTRRAREEIGEDATILDYAEHCAASGTSIAKLARELEEELNLGEISREMVRRVVYLSAGGEDAEARLARARLIGAHAMAEGAQLVAGSVRDRDDVPAAKLLIDTTLWLASRWNRAELAEQKAPSVHISVGALHLDALRVSPPAIARAIGPGEEEVTDAVVES